MEGCRLPVRMQGGDDWPLAEIISIKDVRGQRGYYVHYVDCKLSVGWVLVFARSMVNGHRSVMARWGIVPLPSRRLSL